MNNAKITFSRRKASHCFQVLIVVTTVMSLDVAFRNESCQKSVPLRKVLDATRRVHRSNP
jgi:hypothetical protein